MIATPVSILIEDSVRSNHNGLGRDFVLGNVSILIEDSVRSNNQ